MARSPSSIPNPARWILATGLAGGLGAGLYLSGATTAEHPASSATRGGASQAASAPARSSLSGAAAVQAAFVSALKTASPSVVEITTSSGLGSGVVYDKAGDVVTNAHVVGDSKSFTVLLANGAQVRATLVGEFVPDDLAMVKLASPKGTKPARFADSSKLQPGDLTLAIGSPYGLAGSVTDGIVSSTGRTVSESEGVLLTDLIQTSAAINPGNSGGALVDLSGRVIGISTLAATSQSGAQAGGIGFAIPSNTVRLIAPQLIKSGKVTSAGRAALGVSVGPATDAAGNPVGVYVSAVLPGGAATKAGIVPGEVITTIGGKAVGDVSEMQAILARYKPGAKVAVGLVTSAGTRSTVTVVLGDLAAG